MRDYNVKYVMDLQDPRVLPVNYDEILIDVIREILGYYGKKVNFLSQYAVLEERLKSKRESCTLVRMNHLLHVTYEPKKGWDKKIKKNNKNLDKTLKKHGNKISSKKFSSFETGVTMGNYMRRFDIEEMGAGCTAKYIFSKGLIIPCIFVEARSLSNKKEANKFCRRAAKKIKKTINSKFVTVYESVEYFK